MPVTVATTASPIVTPANSIAGREQGCLVYADYARIPADGNRYEVIGGVLYMAPAPGFDHQNAVGLLSSYLTMHVQFGGVGRVLVAPFDVELARRTIVQPDVLVVLNEHSVVITPTRAVGAPDLVIEVSSPSTATYDRRAKMDAYAAAGVPEYWLVDPSSRTVELLQLEAGAYTTVGLFQGAALLPSRIVPELPVRVEQFFA
jgi:Uma2 family endonuclease